MPEQTRDSIAAGRGAGAAIVIGACTLLVFMALHPTVAARTQADFIAEVAREAPASALAHGVLMAALALVALGLVGFAERLGARRWLVRLGLTAYLAGTLALLAAAIVNGFVVPRFVAAFADEAPAMWAAIEPSLALCRAANRSCDQIGVLSLSAAVLLWSLQMVWRGGGARAAGLLGIACGAIPAVALLAGQLPMNIHGVGGFVLAQSIWYIAVAVLLMRGRLQQQLHA